MGWAEREGGREGRREGGSEGKKKMNDKVLCVHAGRLLLLQRGGRDDLGAGQLQRDVYRFCLLLPEVHTPAHVLLAGAAHAPRASPAFLKYCTVKEGTRELVRSCTSDLACTLVHDASTNKHVTHMKTRNHVLI